MTAPRSAASFCALLATARRAEILLKTDSSSAEILVALEAAIVPAIAVTAFLPLLDGILIALAVAFF